MNAANTKRKKEILKSIAVAALILTAMVCRNINPRSVFLSKLLDNVRAFIYIGIFSAWGVLVNKRVMFVHVRKILIAIASLMVMWIVLRTFKWHYILNPHIIRYFWYFYYIPILLIPMLAIFVSVSVEKPENYRFSLSLYFLLAVTAALIVFVITNDFHQFVFKFDKNAVIYSENNYSYGLGYFLIVLWGVFCSVLSFSIMLAKYKDLPDKKYLWLPALPLTAAILHVIFYAVHFPFILFGLGDIAVFYSLVFVCFFEICIQCGLIGSNARYEDLFNASVGMSVQITDKDYNVFFSSADAKPESVDNMKKAENSPLIIMNKRILHNMPISGGHVVWSESIAELEKLRENLSYIYEELRERKEFLQYEYEKEKTHKTIEEQNRLYDLLQAKTQGQLDKIDELIKEYSASHTEDERQRILSKIVVLGSFIKRRKDFILSVDSTPIIPESKLERAFGESYRALGLLNIKGGFFVKTGREYLSGEILILAYDFFEDITETVLDNAGYINVSVCEIAGKLRININVDCNVFCEKLARKYKNIIIIADDKDGSLFFALPLEGGASS